MTAFVCCDRVISEAGTGKKTIVGIFKNFNFAGLPARFSAPWFVYAQIANLDPGDHVITLNIVHDETQGVVFAANLEIKGEHPDDIDVVIPAHPTEFSREGKYVVSMNLNGSQIAYTVLNVALTPQRVGG